MTAKEFFYLVSQMREAQRDYFKTRDQAILRRARALEGDVDAEIFRVKAIIAAEEREALLDTKGALPGVRRISQEEPR